MQGKFPVIRPAEIVYHNGIDNLIVACPVCANTEDGFSQWVHLTDVRVNAGGQITEITPTGVSQRRGEAAGRGAHIWIGCYGECGHAFDLMLEFYKGSTLVSAESISECGTASYIDDGRIPADLWRD